MKKKMSFEELVQENRKQILEDRALLDRIEQDLEKKMNSTVKEAR